MIMNNKKQDIRAISLENIKEFLVEEGERPFRAKQIYEWLWEKSAHSFEEMSNLSKPLRELLQNHFEINALTIKNMQNRDRKSVV